MPTIQLPNKWKPRFYQRRLWNYLENGGKRAIEVAHRRWGKDDVCLHWASVSMWERVGTYWHMLPLANQARKAIWDAVNPHTGKRRIDEAFPIELRAVTRDNEMFIRMKNGSTWQVLGSDNYEAFIGSPPIGVVFSEWAQANPLAWGLLRPIFAENGGWALFITTPRGKNHALKMLKMAQASMRDAVTNPWFAEVQSTDLTKAIPQDILDNELKEMQSEWGDEQGLSLFEQEYHCSFEASVIGSVYGEWIKAIEKEGRIRKGLYDPSLPVHTAWDLGYDDSTFIWFYQLILDEVRIIDFEEGHQKDVPHYCSQLLGRKVTLDVIDGNFVLKKGADIEGLEQRRGYTYGDHHSPHDGVNKVLAAGGKSIIEQADACGIRMISHPASTQQNQINAARATLKNSWFDERCVDALEYLKQYHFQYDDEKKIFSKEPKHDHNSHAADAYELLGIVRQSPTVQKNPEPAKFWQDQTADQLFGIKGNDDETYQDEL